MGEGLPLTELRQILHRGAEAHRVFAQAEAVVVGVERASREAETLGRRIRGLEGDLGQAQAEVDAKRTELGRLNQEATVLRVETDREHAAQVERLGLDYGQREAREKALHEERLEAMRQSYDEAHATKCAETERLIAEADHALAAAVGRRDRLLEEGDRLAAEIAGLRREKGEAESQLASVRASLRLVLEAARAAMPPDPA